MAGRINDDDHTATIIAIAVQVENLPTGLLRVPLYKIHRHGILCWLAMATQNWMGKDIATKDILTKDIAK